MDRASPCAVQQPLATSCAPRELCTFEPSLLCEVSVIVPVLSCCLLGHIGPRKLVETLHMQKNEVGASLHCTPVKLALIRGAKWARASAPVLHASPSGCRTGKVMFGLFPCGCSQHSQATWSSTWVMSDTAARAAERMEHQPCSGLKFPVP